MIMYIWQEATVYFKFHEAITISTFSIAIPAQIWVHEIPVYSHHLIRNYVNTKYKLSDGIKKYIKLYLT